LHATSLLISDNNGTLNIAIKSSIPNNYIISLETCPVVFQRISSNTGNGSTSDSQSIFCPAFWAYGNCGISGIDIYFDTQAVINIIVWTGTVIGIKLFDPITYNNAITIKSGSACAPVVSA